MNKQNKHFLSTKALLYLLSFICILLIGLSFFTQKITKPIKNLLSIVVVPMQSGVNNMGLWAYNKKEELKDINTLIKENEKLKKQVADLTEKNSMLEQDSYELSRLRTLYDLDKKYEEYTKVGARVIAKDNSNWFNKFTVDKGAKDGILVGMNVIADGGLVGIVIDVNDHSSVIRTIIDDQSVVSCMQIDTGDTCTVSGDLKLIGEGKLKVNNFKKMAEVSMGDAIVTSNISSKFLQGILVGYVEEVSMDKNDLTQSGYIIPVVDFEHLQEVLIIKQLKENGEEE